MNNELLVLCAAAASLGFIHTVVGPDHYLPFIATMLVITLISSFGLRFLVFKPLERWTHALAGGTILLSGLAVSFLGL